MEGYQPFNGIPGHSQNSGCGFYIKENTNCIDRNNLDTYFKNNKHEIQKIFNSENASNKYDIFYEHLNSTIDKHAPLRYLTKNEMAIKSKPWLTKGILKSINTRIKYYKKL